MYRGSRHYCRVPTPHDLLSNLFEFCMLQRAYARLPFLIPRTLICADSSESKSSETTTSKRKERERDPKSVSVVHWQFSCPRRLPARKYILVSLFLFLPLQVHRRRCCCCCCCCCRCICALYTFTIIYCHGYIRETPTRAEPPCILYGKRTDDFSMCSLPWMGASLCWFYGHEVGLSCAGRRFSSPSRRWFCECLAPSHRRLVISRRKIKRVRR